MISVAFFTLYERKLLSYRQNRVGPNKVSFIGLLQPISDAIKLFRKERLLPYKSNKILYIISPIFTLFIPLLIWLIQPFWFRTIEYSITWFLIFCGCAVNVYLVFLSGWVSNSKYSVIGSFRAISQMISYEVALAFIIIFYRIFLGSYIITNYNEISIIFLLYPLGILWFVICLSESQRTPFDLAEGESELVSGFNTEYSSSNFALLFLGEYAAILLMRLLSTILVTNFNINNIFFWIIFIVFFTLFIWCRCTFPRIRYDHLMNYLWKCILPFTIPLCIFFLLWKIIL